MTSKMGNIQKGVYVVVLMIFMFFFGEWMGYFASYGFVDEGMARSISDLTDLLGDPEVKGGGLRDSVDGLEGRLLLLFKRAGVAVLVIVVVLA
jgi:hypothetical protein